MALGIYRDQGGGTITTCLIDGRTFLEFPNGKATTHSTYALTRAATGFALALTGFDRQKLDTAGIPYHFVERELGHALPHFLRARTSLTYKAIVVDNSKLADPSALAAYLTPLSYGMRWY